MIFERLSQAFSVDDQMHVGEAMLAGAARFRTARAARHLPLIAATASTAPMNLSTNLTAPFPVINYVGAAHLSQFSPPLPLS